MKSITVYVSILLICLQACVYSKKTDSSKKQNDCKYVEKHVRDMYLEHLELNADYFLQIDSDGHYVIKNVDGSLVGHLDYGDNPTLDKLIDDDIQ